MASEGERDTIPPPVSRDDFEIAIICAKDVEANAVIAIFDETYKGKYGKASGDTNHYTRGRIGDHYVVLVHSQGMGTVNTANIAARISQSYCNIRLCLVIGVCGAAPRAADAPGPQIYLGDMIISTAIVQTDYGRQNEDGFVTKDTLEDNLPRPVGEIRGFLSGLKLDQTTEDMRARMAEITGAILSQEKYKTKMQRPPANAQEVQSSDPVPNIHFGRMASSNAVMKSAMHRDHLAKKFDLLGYEMEGAGAWDNLPTIVVKSVSDYSDKDKHHHWQAYASLVAAATAKAMLEKWEVSDRRPAAPFVPAPGPPAGPPGRADPISPQPSSGQSQTFSGRFTNRGSGNMSIGNNINRG